MRRCAWAPAIVATMALLMCGACSRAAGAFSPSTTTDSTTAITQRAFDEWLGPAHQDAVAPIDHVSGPAGAMAVDSRVAYQIAVRRFHHLTVADAHLAEGAAWYLQSRVVEQVFNQVFHRPGYRFYTACFFACRLAWPAPQLVLSRWGEGVGRAEFLRGSAGRAWPLLSRSVRLDRRAYGAALAFASLEREMGWPALQGALRVVAQAGAGAAFMPLFEAALGRPVAPVFAIAGGARSDHRIAAVSQSFTERCAAPACRRTEITLASDGVVPFPLLLRVDFADGTHIAVRWQGAGSVAFESAAPAAMVRLDPERVWLLDADYANNTIEAARTTNVPVVKWLARWTVWLQDAALTYTFPV